MVERLRAKPGGDQVRVTMGDFTDFELGTRFRLVFVAFNTLFALPDQHAQLDCFRAVSRHLVPGGRFLVEAFVPDVSRFHRGQLVSAVGVGLDRVDLECSVHDPVTQSISTQRLVFGTGGARSYPSRFATPGRRSSTSWHRSTGCEPRPAGRVEPTAVHGALCPVHLRLGACTDITARRGEGRRAAARGVPLGLAWAGRQAPTSAYEAAPGVLVHSGTDVMTDLHAAPV